MDKTPIHRASLWTVATRCVTCPPFPDLKPAFTACIENLSINGVSVPVFNTVKSMADCFKFRNKIGSDVALEALRDGWVQRKFTMDTMDTIWHFATVDRVANVMRPYLESVTTRVEIWLHRSSTSEATRGCDKARLRFDAHALRSRAFVASDSECGNSSIKLQFKFQSYPINE